MKDLLAAATVSCSKSALLVKARAQMNGPPSFLKVIEVHCIAWEATKAMPVLANMEVQTRKCKPSVHRSGEAEAASVYPSLESPDNTWCVFKGERGIHVPVPCHFRSRLWVKEESGRILLERRQLLDKP